MEMALPFLLYQAMATYFCIPNSELLHISAFQIRRFNGAVGKEQLRWLDAVLRDATKNVQKVVVCSHIPLDPGADAPESLLWNYEEVMEVIHRYECVKVCFARHDHTGRHSIDSRGVHHRVLEAALECPPGSDAFGHVDVYRDRLLLSGADRMRSAEMVFIS